MSTEFCTVYRASSTEILGPRWLRLFILVNFFNELYYVLLSWVVWLLLVLFIRFYNIMLLELSNLPYYLSFLLLLVRMVLLLLSETPFFRDLTNLGLLMTILSFLNLLSTSSSLSSNYYLLSVVLLVLSSSIMSLGLKSSAPPPELS